MVFFARPIILLIYLSTSLITNYISSGNNSSEAREIFYFEQSILIEKPILTVWEYLNDFENCRDYMYCLKSVSKNPEGPNSIGTIITYQFGFLFKTYINYYKVTDYDPPFTMSIKSMDGSDVKAAGTLNIKSVDNSSTKITIKFKPRISGFFASLSDETVDRIYNNTLARILKRVKRNIE